MNFFDKLLDNFFDEFLDKFFDEFLDKFFDKSFDQLEYLQFFFSVRSWRAPYLDTT